VHLWRIDQGKLVAFFLTEADRQDIHLVVHPDHRALEETIFRWAEEQWASGKTQLETYVPRHDTQRQELLARLGYVDGGHSGNLYLFDLLQMDPPSTLAPGFFMEDGTGSIDPLRKIELIKDAFGHTSFERERYDSTFTAPSYNPQLDLTVVTTSGEYVAYCMGWVHSKTLAAAIEPVGVHSAFRRQGLASAIIRECFRRMKGMGAVRCAIGGDSPLYDSLGPEQIISEDRWIKDLRN